MEDVLRERPEAINRTKTMKLKLSSFYSCRNSALVRQLSVADQTTTTAGQQQQQQRQQQKRYDFQHKTTNTLFTVWTYNSISADLLNVKSNTSRATTVSKFWEAVVGEG